jgi:integrase
VPVAVFERERGGLLYARTTGAHGEDIRVSLGHRHREQAKVYALEQAARLRQGRDDIRTGKLPVFRLFALYATHRTPRKTINEQNEDRRRTMMWSRVLGAHKEAARITRGEWERFAELRATGELNASGERVIDPKDRRPVRPRSVQRDLLWLKWVLNWAMTWQDAEGRYLLSANPVRGFEAPSEMNPRRPMASTDRLEKVLAAAEALEMELRWVGKVHRQRAYLADVLVLAAETGRRISPILALRWEDVLWDVKPYGAIRWRADEDKMGQEWTAPVSSKVRSTLDGLRRERPGLGSALLFPSRLTLRSQ